MSPFYVAVQWKIPETQGTNAIVCPWLWSKRGLLSLWWPDAVFCLSFWSIWSLFQSAFRTAYSCEINRPVQLLSSHEEGGQRCLNVGERKSRSPLIAVENSDLLAHVRSKERRKVVFFLLARGFSSVLLRNCNIARGGISWATPHPPACEISQALYATKEGSGNTQKAIFMWFGHQGVA